MTPQREAPVALPNLGEAELRLLTPYAVEYRYDDEAPELLTPAQALAIVAALLAWCDEQMQLHA